MKIAILGAGAIGCLYGYRLQASGACVYLQTNSQYDVVSRDGVMINSPWGDGIFRPEGVASSAEKLSTYGPFDYVLVTTKVLPTVPIVSLLRRLVSTETVIGLIQNGIGIEELLVSAFPTHDLISGLAFVCVSRTQPGYVVHQDFGRLVLGKYPSGYSHYAAQLVTLFDSSGVPCRLDEQIQNSRWKKLVWNAAFNPISVVSGGLTTQAILANLELRHRVHAVMTEICQLATCEGYALGADVVEKNIRDTEAMVNYKTSMLLDYEAGRSLEIEAILGNPLSIAKHHRLDMPYTQRLYDELVTYKTPSIMDI